MTAKTPYKRASRADLLKMNCSNGLRMEAATKPSKIPKNNGVRPSIINSPSESQTNLNL